MNPNQLQKLISGGEGLDLEFKSCRQQLPKNVYETVCAFLNRHGGADPQLIEGDNFRMIISVPEFSENPAIIPRIQKQETPGAESGAQVGAQVDRRERPWARQLSN